MAGRLGIGNGIGIPFRNKVSGGGQSLPPELKEALCGVWIADQNTNDSPTRNIIKNKISGKGGDFEILNAAYKGNSGYGIITDNILFEDWIFYGNQVFGEKINNTTVRFTNVNAPSVDNFYCRNNSRKKQQYKITGLKDGQSVVFGYTNDIIYTATNNGIHEIDWSKTTNAGYQELGFTFKGDCNITIEQIPNYQGAFCTDGVDDLIVSQKNTSEILDFNKDFTVISMITLLKNEDSIYANQTNTVPYNGSMCISSIKRTAIDKTGIFGYYKKDAKVYSINDILGDKDDYLDGAIYIDGYKYPKILVVGAADTTGYIGRNASIAWYWTLIAKRVLTTDEINQVIAYYNLDKYVAPDVYYDVKKQGLTNENHAEFGDKLIDYSGNGKDMQLYNFGWKLDSGVGKYETDWSNGNLWINRPHNKYTSNKIEVIAPLINSWIIFSKDTRNTSFPSYTVRITGIKDAVIKYVYVNEDGNVNNINYHKDGIYIVPESFSQNNKDIWTGFGSNNLNIVGLTIEQLPSFEGALVFDGVEDYGQYIGDLGLKDYTVVADRAYVELLTIQVPIVSNINKGIDTPFILEYSTMLSDTKSCSYGVNTTINKKVNANKEISYQSTYVYNRNPISRGTSTNTGNGLTFGRYGEDGQYAKLCLYNFMLFPYSLSEFLIERQLKKRKIGTLHPETNNK